jgi:hypothetical protein
MPSHPEPEDEELLMEAFFIALLNGRTRMLEYMVSRGFNVDTLVWGSPIIGMAIGNAMTPVVECLVRCGANLDIRGWRPENTARETAREMLEMFPADPDRRRIVELCGMDPDAILAARAAQPVEPPGVAPELQKALELAGDDAFRMGQSEIREENLLFGLLRGGGLPTMYFTKVSHLDLDRFREDVKDRIGPGDERVERPKLFLAPESQVVIQTAIAAATERRRTTMHGLHVLYALTRSGNGPAVEWLERYGGSAASLTTQLERSM